MVARSTTTNACSIKPSVSQSSPASIPPDAANNLTGVFQAGSAPFRLPKCHMQLPNPKL
jgi:hypothetical protein